MVNQLLLNGVIAGSICSLVALGFSIIYQTTRFSPAFAFRFGGAGPPERGAGWHFAHGAVYTVITHLPALFGSLWQAGMTQIVRRYSSRYTHRTDHTYYTDYHAG